MISARLTTASGTGRLTQGGGSRGWLPRPVRHLSRSVWRRRRRYLRNLLRRRWKAGRRSTARVRFALRPADYPRRSGFRRRKRNRGHKLETCARCHAIGAEGGSRSIGCPTCAGRSRVISSRGFFQVSQTCPRCRGVGRVIEKPCHGCDGEGRVENGRIRLTIPAGIADGSRLRSSGNGEAEHPAAVPPWRICTSCIHVKEHKSFQRDEDNLYCDVPIPFSVAALGGEVAVPARSKAGPISRCRPEHRADRFSNCAAKVSANVNGRTRWRLARSPDYRSPDEPGRRQRQSSKSSPTSAAEGKTRPCIQGFRDRAKEFFRERLICSPRRNPYARQIPQIDPELRGFNANKKEFDFSISDPRTSA